MAEVEPGSPGSPVHLDTDEEDGQLDADTADGAAAAASDQVSVTFPAPPVQAARGALFAALVTLLLGACVPFRASWVEAADAERLGNRSAAVHRGSHGRNKVDVTRLRESMDTRMIWNKSQNEANRL